MVASTGWHQDIGWISLIYHVDFIHARYDAKAKVVTLCTLLPNP